MKLQKYLIIMLLAATTTGFLSSCSDNDNKGDAPRLFRPIASLETNNNTITATWDNISGATSYNLTLYKVTGTDEAGDNIYEVVTTASCKQSPYTFTDLAWDEKYMVEINCEGDSKSSKTYNTKDVNVSYPTSLKQVKTIDNAARITWDLSGVTIKAIVAVPEDDGEEIVKTVSSSAYNAGTIDVTGLQPSTKYTFYAYSDSENFTNSTYAGKVSGTTSKPVDFDAEYGAGNWIDIRDYDENQAKDTLKTTEFWEQVKDGSTIILRGDFDYKVNNSYAINKSVRFVTASTLGGNARFVSSGGLTLAKNVTVDFLEFKDVDFYSDKALGDNKVKPISEGGGNAPGFGGRQVFNINGTKSTLKKISFSGCHIEGYRAIVRCQADGDNVNEIIVDNCVINGVGDQGAFTTNNKNVDLKSITLKNSTLTNIVQLCDLRKTTGDIDFNISNCTFCYAPIEKIDNANNPLFRINGNANTVKLNVYNTLFGPSLSTDGGTSNIKPYEAGVSGSIFLNASETTLPSVTKSFKTNFTWTVVAEKTYPLDGLQELSLDEKELWNSPATGEFKITGQVGEDGVGDPRGLQ